MSTGLIVEWKDITTYSRDDKERLPTSYAMEVGSLRITITCGHIYYRPAWVMHCVPLAIDSKQLYAKDLEEAKQKAIDIVGREIAKLQKAFDVIYEAGL